MTCTDTLPERFFNFLIYITFSCNTQKCKNNVNYQIVRRVLQKYAENRKEKGHLYWWVYKVKKNGNEINISINNRYHHAMFREEDLAQILTKGDLSVLDEYDNIIINRNDVINIENQTRNKTIVFCLTKDGFERFENKTKDYTGNLYTYYDGILINEQTFATDVMITAKNNGEEEHQYRICDNSMSGGWYVACRFIHPIKYPLPFDIERKDGYRLDLSKYFVQNNPQKEAVVPTGTTLKTENPTVTTLKITDFNRDANTFSFVDVATGKKLSYSIIVIDGQRVVNTECIIKDGTEMVKFVLKEKQLLGTRQEGGQTVSTYSGESYTSYSIYAELKYSLKDGVLTINR